MILVDTSVWIDHFHRANAILMDALEREDVLTHPFVIGELACGQLKDRGEILDLLSALPSTLVADDRETLHFIERRRLVGKGIGYIDAHLLAAVTLTENVLLWTADKRLGEVASDLRVRQTCARPRKTRSSPVSSLRAKPRYAETQRIHGGTR